jgi:hypothetical protein
MFRNKYITSPQPRTFMNFRIMYDIDGGGYTEFCNDTGLGYNNALALSPDPVTDIYIVDKIHSPDSSGTITYKLQYYIDASGGDVATTDISLGVLESSGNSIILEELAFSGTNALPQWTVGDSNSLYYDDGNIGIGKEATQGIITKDISNTTVLNGPLALDVSGNTRIDGVLDMSNHLIVDVSGIWFNNESYIGVGNSLDITSLEPIKFNNRGLIIDGNKVGIGMLPTGTDLFQISGNIQIDTGSRSKIVFYDGPNVHEHGEIDATRDGVNGGIVKIKTKVNCGEVTEKLRIDNIGRIGLGGANYGTVGQLLTSNGNSAPTWTSINAITVVKTSSFGIRVPNTTNITVTFTEEIRDTNNWINTPSVTITPDITGTYLINCSTTKLNYTVDGFINIILNGNIIATTNDLSVSVYNNITSGESISVVIYQNSGSAQFPIVTLGVQLISPL